MKKELIFWGIFSLFTILLFELGIMLYDNYVFSLIKSSQNINMFTPKENGSYSLNKNLNIKLIVEGKHKYIKSNSLGYPWHEFKVKKKKKRIAFIGDSFTQGLWAKDYSKSFVGIFNDDIKNNSINYEVLNFGIGGYGLGDELLLLKEEVFKYKPDIVVLMLYTLNDFRDTYLGINKYSFVDGACYLDTLNIENKIPKKYCYPNKNYKKKEPIKPPVFNGHFIYRNSHLYRFATNLLHNKEKTVDNFKSFKNFKKDIHFTHGNFWSSIPLPEVGEKAISYYLSLLDSTISILTDSNIEFVVFSIPNKIQVYSDSLRGKGYNLFYPQKYVEDFLYEKNINYHDLLVPIRNLVHNKHIDLYMKKDYHFNDRGHKEAGKMLFEKLSPLLKN